MQEVVHVGGGGGRELQEPVHVGLGVEVLVCVQVPVCVRWECIVVDPSADEAELALGS